MGGFLFVHVRLAMSAGGDHNYLKSFENPRAFSQYSLILKDLYPGLDPENAFDNNPSSCFREPLSQADLQATALPAENRSTIPNYANPTLSGELGLSHGAGHPPTTQDFSFINIVFCNSEHSVQPARVRVQLFRQKLYDVDRQYRIPDAPELWSTFEFNLNNRSSQRFPLDLEPFAESAGFPDGFYNVWVRLIFSMPVGGQIHGNAPGGAELCIRSIQVGHRNYFAHSEAGDHTCP